MKQDFTFFDVESLLEFISLGDRPEHEGYFSDLEQLDFSQEEQARAAIRRWLLPEFERSQGQTAVGRRRVRTALRVAISRWGLVPCTSDLPGIDQVHPPYRPKQQTLALKRQFSRWLWDELFHAPFGRIANTDDLQERADDTFVNAPNNPELWGPPRYRSLTHWDALLRIKEWPDKWPPDGESRTAQTI